MTLAALCCVSFESKWLEVGESDPNASSAVQGEMKVSTLKECNWNWKTRAWVEENAHFFFAPLARFNQSLNQDKGQPAESLWHSSGKSGVNTGR